MQAVQQPTQYSSGRSLSSWARTQEQEQEIDYAEIFKIGEGEGDHPWCRRDLRNDGVRKRLYEGIASRIYSGFYGAVGPADDVLDFFKDYLRDECVYTNMRRREFTVYHRQTIGRFEIEGKMATIYRVWTILHQSGAKTFECTPSRNFTYLHETDGSDDGDMLEGPLPAGIKRWKDPDLVDLDLSFKSCVRNLPKEVGVVARIVRKIDCAIFYLLSSGTSQRVLNRFSFALPLTDVKVSEYGRRALTVLENRVFCLDYAERSADGVTEVLRSAGGYVRKRGQKASFSNDRVWSLASHSSVLSSLVLTSVVMIGLSVFLKKKLWPLALGSVLMTAASVALRVIGEIGRKLPDDELRSRCPNYDRNDVEEGKDNHFLIVREKGDAFNPQCLAFRRRNLMNIRKDADGTLQYSEDIQGA